jgi:hypothetical protein
MTSPSGTTCGSGRHDGVAAVIEKLKGHPLFAHVTLGAQSERSAIAALVSDLLDGHRRLSASQRCGSGDFVQHASDPVALCLDSVTT